MRRVVAAQAAHRGGMGPSQVRSFEERENLGGKIWLEIRNIPLKQGSQKYLSLIDINKIDIIVERSFFLSIFVQS